MARSSRKDLDRLKTDIRALQADLDALAHDAKKTVGNSVDGGVDRLVDTLSSLRERAEDLGSRGEESVEAIRDTVRERPFGSVLTAFAVGLALASLTGRRA